MTSGTGTSPSSPVVILTDLGLGGPFYVRCSVCGPVHVTWERGYGEAARRGHESLHQSGMAA